MAVLPRERRQRFHVGQQALSARPATNADRVAVQDVDLSGIKRRNIRHRGGTDESENETAGAPRRAEQATGITRRIDLLVIELSANRLEPCFYRPA